MNSAERLPYGLGRLRNPTTGSGSTPVAATAYHQQDKPSGGDGAQRRHGPPCAARRQYQLEERDGIAKTLWQSAQRAISAVGDNEYALYQQRR